jgi:ubiquinone/menaquinone biosynthesis C-methylase UbiE
MKKLFGAILLAAVICPAQEVHPVTKRPIAGVMGMGGADWLTRPERASEEHPDEALDAIGIAPGSVIADIGAGVGYFTEKLARRAGATGKVYANDIQPAMLEQLRKNMAAAHIVNFETTLGSVDDPRLPQNTIDLALLVDVYHEFSKPQEMLRHIRESLKPGGRLVLLEYRKEDPNVPIRPEHKMSVKGVRAEIEPEGFRFEKVIETLPEQHILIFTRPVLQ